MNIYWAYITAIGLIAAGIYGLLVKRHAFKIIISLGIIGSGVNLLLISIGYVLGATAPIYTRASEVILRNGTTVNLMVDPLPQALVLTAIVIETSILAAALSIAIHLYREHRTLDLRVIRRLRW